MCVALPIEVEHYLDHGDEYKKWYIDEYKKLVKKNICVVVVIEFYDGKGCVLKKTNNEKITIEDIINQFDVLDAMSKNEH